ncbi:MAG TPA: exosortase/archaeosortase family protein [Chloroflexota bacterium]|nr:exosortase/archaeosortase family protein [Chloroflexota bacterium]
MIAARRSRNATSPAASLLLPVVAVAAAFWFTLWRATTGGLDSPLGIAPAAVPLAAWAGYLALRRQQAAEPARELGLDGPVGLALMGLALWLVWAAPNQLGWRYWGERRDLLAFEAFALGVACFVLGVATTWRARPALLVLALGSPPVLIWLEEHLAPPLAGFTALAGHLAAGVLSLHFQADAAFNVFQGTADAGTPYYIAIVEACSGLSSWISVVLTGIPAALYLGLGMGGAVAWLLAGLVLATLANVLRIAVLLFLAQHAGPDLALGVVHPVLGTVLLFGVLLLLLLGVEGEPLPPRLGWKWEPDRWSLLAVGVLAVVSMAGQFGLTRFAQLPSGGPPGPRVNDPLAVLPELSGFDRQIQHEIGWQNLFGPSSRSYLATYEEPSGVSIVSQLVTTPDFGKLMTYTPDRCDIYHGEDVRGERTVDLGYGQVGFLVDSQNTVPVDASQPQAGKRLLQTNILYWYVPFTLNGQTWNARYLLILDADDSDKMPPLPSVDQGLAPGGPSFDRVDSHLVEIGRQFTANLAVASGSA